MVYAKVEDGEVVKTGDVPKNTNITSNFYLFSDEEKKTQGWYNIISDNSILKSWESQDGSTYEYSSETDTVVESKIVNTMTLTEFKVFKLKEINRNTQDYVYSKTPNYKQMSALAGTYSTEENDKIINLGKGTVIAYDVLKDEILAMTTLEEVDAADNVIELPYEE